MLRKCCLRRSDFEEMKNEYKIFIQKFSTLWIIYGDYDWHFSKTQFREILWFGLLSMKSLKFITFGNLKKLTRQPNNTHNVPLQSFDIISFGMVGDLVFKSSLLFNQIDMKYNKPIIFLKHEIITGNLGVSQSTNRSTVC